MIKYTSEKCTTYTNFAKWCLGLNSTGKRAIVDGYVTVICKYTPEIATLFVLDPGYLVTPQDRKLDIPYHKKELTHTYDIEDNTLEKDAWYFGNRHYGTYSWNTNIPLYSSLFKPEEGTRYLYEGGDIQKDFGSDSILMAYGAKDTREIALFAYYSKNVYDELVLAPRDITLWIKDTNCDAGKTFYEGEITGSPWFVNKECTNLVNGQGDILTFAITNNTDDPKKAVITTAQIENPEDISIDYSVTLDRTGGIKTSIEYEPKEVVGLYGASEHTTNKIKKYSLVSDMVGDGSNQHSKKIPFVSLFHAYPMVVTGPSSGGGQFGAAGGEGPYTWSTSGGTITPTGYLDITGSCGTITVTATDACGRSAYTHTLGLAKAWRKTSDQYVTPNVGTIYFGPTIVGLQRITKWGFVTTSYDSAWTCWYCWSGGGGFYIGGGFTDQYQNLGPNTTAAYLYAEELGYNQISGNGWAQGYSDNCTIPTTPIWCPGYVPAYRMSYRCVTRVLVEECVCP